MLRKRSLVYPKGTYRTVPFYFRGGDTFQEQEYKISEVKQLKSTIRRLEEELQDLRSEYEEINGEYQRKESYVNQLAEKKGQSSQLTSENTQIRAQIAKITQEIAEVEMEIDECKAMTNPNNLELLETEHAEYLPEFASEERSMIATERRIKGIKNEIIQQMLSEEYKYSIYALIEDSSAVTCRAKIRSNLSNLMTSMNQKPSANNSKRTASLSEQSEVKMTLSPLFDQRTELTLQKSELLLQKKLYKIHKETTTKTLLDYSESLNEQLVLNGLEPIDISEIRSKISPKSSRIEEDRPQGNA